MVRESLDLKSPTQYVTVLGFRSFGIILILYIKPECPDLYVFDPPIPL